MLLDRKHPGVHHIQGMIFKESGQLRAAEASYRHALTLREDANVRHSLGIVLADQGRYDEAILEISKSLCCRNVANTRATLASVLAQKGDFAGCEREARHALAHDPALLVAYDALSMALSELGRDEEALVTAKRSIELDPKRSRSYSNAAAVLGRIGRHKEAVEMCRKALALGPNPYASANMSGALHELGERAEALEAAKDAVRTAPRSAFAHAALGWAFLNDGNDPSAARSAFVTAQRLDPRNMAAAEGLKELRKLEEEAARSPKPTVLRP